MDEKTLINLLTKAQQGNEQAREELILAYRPLINKVAASKCGRFLDWANDDELSIALLAFNQAIDKYQVNTNSNFASFATMVISHRLIDYFRQEGKHRHLLLSQITEDNNNYLPGELEAAEESFQKKNLQENRQEELILFSKLLAEYKISLEDLCRSSPKHMDTKLNLARIAQLLISDASLLHKMTTTKMLPIKELMLLTGASRKVLDSGRRYIIALVIIFSHQLHHIKTFIQLPCTDQFTVSHQGEETING